MSGPTPPPGSPPPEVPEEFAATYRAAYERAMAEHPDPHEEHGPDADPEGRPAPHEHGAGRLVAVLRRLRSSGWLVPILLGVLAVLLILIAYVLGRQVADTVEDATVPGDESAAAVWQSEEGGQRSDDATVDRSAGATGSASEGPGQLSRIMVTGPSLASSTVMSAPKTPRST